MRWPAYVALICLACSEGGSSSGGGGGGPRAAKGLITVGETSAPEDAAADDAGAITGRVTFDGQAPARPPLTTVAGTPGCLEHGADPPLAEQVIVDAEGNLANVVVRLLRAPDPPPPAGDVLVVDQSRCMFVPHVAAVQAGRRVQVRNSDGIAHNVRLIATRNETENLTMSANADPIALDLAEAEICQLVCDLHPWMKGWLVVVEHPWFAVSAEDGTFVIEGVPPGTYGLEAWHERYRRLTLREIVVPPGGTVETAVVFRP